MAAANVTVGSEMCTIETSNTNAFTITKDLPTRAGKLVCGGANKVYVSFPNSAGATVTPVTSDVGQVQGLIGIDRAQLGFQGIPFPKQKPTCQFISITGASVLYWIPEE